MKIRKHYLSAVIFFVLFLLSCTKETSYLTPNKYPNTPAGNFEAFWNGIDQNYIFFNYDPIDWDALYSQYSPLVNSGTSDAELFTIMKAMFIPLIDGHRALDADSIGYVNLLTNYSTKYPNVNTETLVNVKYLDTNRTFDIGGHEDNSADLSLELRCGALKRYNIGYLRVRFFGDGLQTRGADFDTSYINPLQQITAYKGIILDLRHNNGGYASAFYNLVSRFVNTNYQWGYSQTRLERDRNVMSPLIPESVSPNKSGFYDRKLIILTDRYSFSSAEITTMALKYLPNVTIIGDTTGGANGPISDTKDYTGDFTLPNGWKVQLAQRITLDKNKILYEGKGIPPAIVEQPSQESLNNGIDNVLERAIVEMQK